MEAKNVKFRTTVVPNDTIEVVAERPAPGFFAKLFGRDSVDVRAQGRRPRRRPWAARWARADRDRLTGTRSSQCSVDCWDEITRPTLDFEKVGPGAFRLINIDGSYGGTGLQDIGDWISDGLNEWMDDTTGGTTRIPA